MSHELKGIALVGGDIVLVYDEGEFFCRDRLYTEEDVYIENPRKEEVKK